MTTSTRVSTRFLALLALLAACTATEQPPPPAPAPPTIGSTPPARPVPIPSPAPRPEGTGGTGGTGGGAGAGGAPTPADTAPPMRQPDAGAVVDAPARGPVGNPALDDLEDCDEAIPANDGRSGSWYLYLDELGSTLLPAMWKPEAPGLPGSAKCAVHLRGMTVNNPGMMIYGYAGAGFTYTGTIPFDSSGYDGISFWAKGTGQIRAAVSIPATTDVMFGGTCTTECGDSFGLIVDVTPEWKRYEIRWSEISQSGWGTAATFDERQMTGIDFGFESGWTFDVWIDDVAYLTPAGSGGDGGVRDGGPPDARR